MEEAATAAVVGAIERTSSWFVMAGCIAASPGEGADELAGATRAEEEDERMISDDKSPKFFHDPSGIEATNQPYRCQHQDASRPHRSKVPTIS